jgi:hypothetical protein
MDDSVAGFEPHGQAGGIVAIDDPPVISASHQLNTAASTRPTSLRHEQIFRSALRLDPTSYCVA